MDRAGFDPRFSPEFQRGFDPVAHEGPAATAESQGRIDPVPTPAVRRIPAVPVAGQTVSGQAAPGQIVVSDGAEAPFGTQPGLEDAATSAVYISPWRNPYLIVLSALGVLLIGGGTGAYRWSLDRMYGGGVYEEGLSSEEMEEAMLAVQLAWGLAPLLVLAGVLTLLGVFFFVAWRWRPRARAGGDELEDFSDGDVTG